MKLITTEKNEFYTLKYYSRSGISSTTSSTVAVVVKCLPSPAPARLPGPSQLA